MTEVPCLGHIMTTEASPQKPSEPNHQWRHWHVVGSSTEKLVEIFLSCRHLVSLKWHLTPSLGLWRPIMSSSQCILCSLNQLMTPLPVCVTVLHQRRGHGGSELCDCRSGSSITSAWPVPSVGDFYRFPAVFGNIYIFEYCPVQRATKQEEQQEEEVMEPTAVICTAHFCLSSYSFREASDAPLFTSASCVHKGFPSRHLHQKSN